MSTATAHDPTTEVSGVRIVERPSASAAVVRVSGAVEELPRMIGDAFHASAAAIAQSGARIVGPPFARYLAFGRRVQAEVGFPYGGDLVETARVYRTELPGGRLVTTTHIGSYDSIGETWDRARLWMLEAGLETSSPPWEAYLTGPDDPGPPITEIFWPLHSGLVRDNLVHARGRRAGTADRARARG